MNQYPFTSTGPTSLRHMMDKQSGTILSDCKESRTQEEHTFS